MAQTQTSSATHWALGREMIACSSCHQIYLGDMEMEKNSLQDKSGLEDKCSPLLHPWGLGVWSPPYSKSQPHKDLMELQALQLHSTNLMQQGEETKEARPSCKRHQNKTVTAQDWDCLLILAKEYKRTKNPTQPTCAGMSLLLPGVQGRGRNEPAGQKVPAWHNPTDPEAGAATPANGKGTD